jgi:ureidoglycolate lyase
MSTRVPSTTIVTEPLIEGAFTPYGEILAPPATPGRRPHLDLPAHSDRPVVLSTTTTAPHVGPLVVRSLERHPHSTQTFVPVSVGRWIVIVASSADGGGMRAFEVPQGVGVTIGRGVWHHGLTVLDSPGSFAVLMCKDGVTDDEFVDVAPVAVEVSP